MRLQYYSGSRPNFGDDLNSWLWPKLLPSFLDEDPSVLFIGIGSILGNHYDQAAKKIVFGTGFVPSYHDAPNVHGADWDIFFVRGPRTARSLKLPEKLGIGDGAILIRAIDLPRPALSGPIGFMPHWESLSRGNWKEACDLAGVQLVDPTWSVDAVLNALLGCKFLITEAMHGAIVADSLRIPWIPVLPLDGIHRQKWLDWAEALGISLTSHRLWPSSVEEAKLAFVRRPLLHQLAGSLALPGVAGLSERALTHTAAHRLEALARMSPCMSRDDAINTATEKMLEKLRLLKTSYPRHAVCP